MDKISSNADKVILHSDCNSFYASVEELYDPPLKAHAVAVSGDPEMRQGIILARNGRAKGYGIKTGEAVWQAKQKCPELVLVAPHYDLYMQMSKLCRCIYGRYTDLVEPMGMDECFLDVSGCERYLKMSGREVAEDIRRTVREELGITVSVGVSFNKVFAKLGSDLKKPDAVTEIPYECFRERIWQLPADSMIGVGHATAKKLASAGVHTLGELAAVPPELMRAKFGKVGAWLWAAANGLDCGEVMPFDYTFPIKSIGHGSNALYDLTNNAEVWNFMLWLSVELAYRMRRENKKAYGVCVAVREKELACFSYQRRLTSPTSNDAVIAKAAYELFCEKHIWRSPLRSVSITAIHLDERDAPEQLDIFASGDDRRRTDTLDDTVDMLNRAYGRGTVTRASCMANPTLPKEKREIIMPNSRYMNCDAFEYR